MADYKLIALDIDGTLLNSELKLTEANKNAVGQVFASGRQAVLCTGRCLSELRDLLGQLPQIRYLICENGSCVYDLKYDQTIHVAPVPDEEIRFVLGLMKKERVAIQAFCENQSYINKPNDEWMIACRVGNYREVFNRSSIWDVRLFDRYYERPFRIEKINLYLENERDRQRILKVLEDRPAVKTVPSFGYMIEVVSERADKGVGLEKLCAYLNVPVEETIAMGDSANDVEVLRTAALSVAVGNACAEAKEAADIVTVDCDHDAVAKIIGEYMLKKA